MLHRAAEKGLLAHPREDGDQKEAATVCAVYQARGEFIGYLAQGGQETVSEEPQRHRNPSGQGTEEYAPGDRIPGEPEVEPTEGAPQRGRDGEETIEEAREKD